MNRKQFLSLAGKYRKLTLQLQGDAKRVQVSSHPYSDYAERIRALAAEFEGLAKQMEREFS
jgi:hypothetical protein